MYKYILETEYSYAVSNIYLGVFHPNRYQPACIEIPSLDYEIGMIVDAI